jgi:hypothetical protein
MLIPETKKTWLGIVEAPSGPGLAGSNWRNLGFFGIVHIIHKRDARTLRVDKETFHTAVEFTVRDVLGFVPLVFEPFIMIMSN